MVLNAIVFQKRFLFALFIGLSMAPVHLPEVRAAVEVNLPGNPWYPATPGVHYSLTTVSGYERITLHQTPPGGAYWIKAVGEDIWVCEDINNQYAAFDVIIADGGDYPFYGQAGADCVYMITLSGTRARLQSAPISGNLESGIWLRQGGTGTAGAIALTVDGQI